MKRILLLIILIGCHLLPAIAQKDTPKWMEKSKKAIVAVTTYGKDGNKLASGTGFFVSETGDVVSAYDLFKGADKATVTDSEGKTFPVETILGADEMYDVIKFKVTIPKKVPFLSIANEPLTNGATVYLLPYSSGKNVISEKGTIVEVSKLKDPFGYYKISFPLKEGQINAPFLTADGEVFGLAQDDASGKKQNSFAVSAGYVNSLAISSADFLSSIYKSMSIKKAWPTDVDQALVALFLKGSGQDAKSYLEILNDFIATFPNTQEGYLNRSNHYAFRRAELAATPAEQMKYLNLAVEDIKTASKFGNKKGDANYNLAKLIYSVVLNDSTLSDPAWTIPVALETVQKAIKEDDQPVYHQLIGDIYFYQKQYEPAYNEYMIVNNSDAASSLTYYWAAKAKEQISGFNIGDVIALLDSAVNKCGAVESPEAAAYILERIDWKLRLSQYPAAVEDYNLYFVASGGKVGADFFFFREQAKFRANDLPGALKDIQEAIRLSPDTPDYYAEEASVFVRMQKYDNALASLEKALALAPDFGACYRLKGICYSRQGKKTEACDVLKKAKELGDPLADKLIKENCK